MKSSGRANRNIEPTANDQTWNTMKKRAYCKNHKKSYAKFVACDWKKCSDYQVIQDEHVVLIEKRERERERDAKETTILKKVAHTEKLDTVVMESLRQKKTPIVR